MQNVETENWSVLLCLSEQPVNELTFKMHTEMPKFVMRNVNFNICIEFQVKKNFFRLCLGTDFADSK